MQAILRSRTSDGPHRGVSFKINNEGKNIQISKKGRLWENLVVFLLNEKGSEAGGLPWSPTQGGLIHKGRIWKKILKIFKIPTSSLRTW